MVVRYDEVKDGDRVWVQGYRFTARNVRVLPAYNDPGVLVVRFEGRCDPTADIANTSYNGGTYGGRVDLKVTIERDEQAVQA
jgi:hypothetical protein